MKHLSQRCIMKSITVAFLLTAGFVPQDILAQTRSSATSSSVSGAGAALPLMADDGPLPVTLLNASSFLGVEPDDGTNAWLVLIIFVIECSISVSLSLVLSPNQLPLRQAKACRT